MISIHFIFWTFEPVFCGYGFVPGSGCGVFISINRVARITDISQVHPCLLVQDARSLNEIVQTNTFGTYKYVMSAPCIHPVLTSDCCHISERIVTSIHCVELAPHGSESYSLQPTVEVCQNGKGENVPMENCPPGPSSYPPCILRENLQKEAF